MQRVCIVLIQALQDFCGTPSNVRVVITQRYLKIAEEIQEKQIDHNKWSEYHIHESCKDETSPQSTLDGIVSLLTHLQEAACEHL